MTHEENQLINELFSKYSKGDTGAYSELYQRFYARYFKFIKSKIKNHHTAEDIVSDTFVSVLKHKEKVLSFDEKQLRLYISAITENKCLDLLNKNKKVPETSLEDLDHVLKSNESPVDEQVISGMNTERIMGFVEKLNSKYRIVFELKYLSDFTTKQIAEQLNISQDNVKARTRRAKIKLRELLEREVKVNV
jgi:RNA polymerase sigma-70 factor (ECF subfamily)